MSKSKIKMRYSIYDNKTGYFTKYRTATFDNCVITNELGFILFDDSLNKCREEAKKVIKENFRPINFQIIEQYA